MERLCQNRRPAALTKRPHFARIPVLLQMERMLFVGMPDKQEARIAQLVEQLALNQTVGGSNPSARTDRN